MGQPARAWPPGVLTIPGLRNKHLGRSQHLGKAALCEDPETSLFQLSEQLLESMRVFSDGGCLIFKN
jgi:hypothetical protein